MLNTHVIHHEAGWSLHATETVVAAYVSKNPISASDLPSLIASVFKALDRLDGLREASVEEEQSLTPAVPIKKSVTPDYIICLDDGLKFRSLKRHIATLGMTPEQYRAKWGLPDSYPMTAPSYSTKRSELAKANGLGTKR